MFYQTKYSSPIGELILVSNETSLVGLWIAGQKYFLGSLQKEKIQNGMTKILEETKKWLDRYFQFENPAISDLLLEPGGRPFQKKVWEILCQIPYGQTITYGEIARMIAKETGQKTMSAQAIGGAVGHNPISIIIPCHRVIGVNGNLTGYAGGIDKKIELLKREKVKIDLFKKPKKSTAM